MARHEHRCRRCSSAVRPPSEPAPSVRLDRGVWRCSTRSSHGVIRRRFHRDDHRAQSGGRPESGTSRSRQSRSRWKMLQRTIRCAWCMPLRSECLPRVTLVCFRIGYRGTVVLDMVYNPHDTVLLKRAAAQGATVIHGSEMLLEQAARQFEIWTGESAPRAVMAAALAGQAPTK